VFRSLRLRWQSLWNDVRVAGLGTLLLSSRRVDRDTASDDLWRQRPEGQGAAALPCIRLNFQSDRLHAAWLGRSALLSIAPRVSWQLSPRYDPAPLTRCGEHCQRKFLSGKKVPASATRSRLFLGGSLRAFSRLFQPARIAVPTKNWAVKTDQHPGNRLRDRSLARESPVARSTPPMP
jgi:hypothetical protein